MGLAKTRLFVVRTLLAACVMTLTGCFTGVESTPKITGKDVRQRHITTSPEARMLADIRPKTLSFDSPDKRFYILDSRVSRVLESVGDSASFPNTHSLLKLDSIASLASITGTEVAILHLSDSLGHHFSYKTGLDSATLISLRSSVIPFTVEADIVDTIACRLTGLKCFVLPARRLTSDGRDTTGLRYSPVTITGVTPGNSSYPLRVTFTDADGTPLALMMTFGDGPSATRNFDKLFSLTDPRRSYDLITDRIWQLITQSRVDIGMTPRECRLALGPPNEIRRTPTRGGMIERWTYDDGTFLIFEDGTLTRFR